jgi:hypothetical protein
MFGFLVKQNSSKNLRRKFSHYLKDDSYKKIINKNK